MCFLQNSAGAGTAFKGIELKDYLSALAIVASTIVAVLSWKKSASKDREQVLFVKRTDRRFAMARQVIEIIVSMNDPEPFVSDPQLGAKIGRVRTDVQLYGTRQEQQAYQAFVHAIESSHGDTNDANIKKIVATLVVLRDLMLKAIRDDMGFKD
jgi:hypothetical protein